MGRFRFSRRDLGRARRAASSWRFHFRVRGHARLSPHGVRDGGRGVDYSFGNWLAIRQWILKIHGGPLWRQDQNYGVKHSGEIPACTHASPVLFADVAEYFCGHPRVHKMEQNPQYFSCFGILWTSRAIISIFVDTRILPNYRASYLLTLRYRCA